MANFEVIGQKYPSGGDPTGTERLIFVDNGNGTFAMTVATGDGTYPSAASSIVAGSGVTVSGTAPGGGSIAPLVDTNGKTVVGATATANAVDFLNVTNGAAGNPGVVALAAAGSDTNVSISLASKGTGVLSFVGGSGTGGLTLQPGADSNSAIQIENAAGTTSVLVVDTTNGRVGINGQPSVGAMQILGTVPADVGTANGTDFSGYVLVTNTASRGGNTTIATTGTGGLGGRSFVVAGSGGQATLAAVSSTGGPGGTIELGSGTGGAAAVAGTGNNHGGNGGTALLGGAASANSAGAGGAATGVTTGTNTGGNGGPTTLAGTNGGAASGGATNNGGTAGNLFINGGVGGTGASAAGAGGDIVFQTTPTTGALVEAMRISHTASGISFTGQFTKYNNVNTAGAGVAPIVGLTSQKNETTAADANVLTVTPPAAAGTYRVSVSISVSAATNGVISWTLSYKDSNGNTQTNVAQQIFQQATAAPNTTFTTSAAGNYYGSVVIDIDNSATNIVVKWVGGGTTTAKMSASIERLN